jgi:uncharacterized protein (TIGR02757 family)
LKIRLEALQAEFEKSQEILNDAQEPARKYQHPRDQEFAAYVCSAIAYGKVAHIKNSIHRLLDPMGESPVQYLLEASPKELKFLTAPWKHRFNTAQDALWFLTFLKAIYSEHATLEEWISPQESETVFSLMERWVENFENHSWPRGMRAPSDKDSIWFLFPRPSSGGACKRMNLFLRWMVGKGKTDFGLWKRLMPRQLIIPLDVHVHRQALKLKLTKRKAGDWKTALEITEALKKLDAEDPTRFDFALCHAGIRGLDLLR